MSTDVKFVCVWMKLTDVFKFCRCTKSSPPFPLLIEQTIFLSLVDMAVDILLVNQIWWAEWTGPPTFSSFHEVDLLDGGLEGTPHSQVEFISMIQAWYLVNNLQHYIFLFDWLCIDPSICFCRVYRHCSLTNIYISPSLTQHMFFLNAFPTLSITVSIYIYIYIYIY